MSKLKIEIDDRRLFIEDGNGVQFGVQPGKEDEFSLWLASENKVKGFAAHGFSLDDILAVGNALVTWANERIAKRQLKLERSLFGQLLDGEPWNPTLSTGFFSIEIHRSLFVVLRSLRKDKLELSAETVIARLTERSDKELELDMLEWVGGASYIRGLAKKTSRQDKKCEHRSIEYHDDPFSCWMCDDCPMVWEHGLNSPDEMDELTHLLNRNDEGTP